MDRVIAALLGGLGPAIPRASGAEALRAALGAALGLLITGALLFLISPSDSLWQHPLLIAPFAASAVLIFAVPNSPLAQPWAVVVGNTAAGLIGLITVQLVPATLLAIALAVGGALLATAALRATHPPAGAVAMAMVLAPHPIGFALHPVLTGSLLLVICGMFWNFATGRPYPFRPVALHGTKDAAPERRLAPSPETLAAALQRLRLGDTIGVEDLARVIDSAEAETAAHALGQVTAAAIMSRDLITAQPDTTLPELAQMFRAHRFKSLPIRDGAGAYHGCVTIEALAGRADPDLTAASLADAGIKTASAATPLADLIRLLSDGGQQTVPILAGSHLAGSHLAGSHLVGLVTRSDLIAVLIHHLSHEHKHGF
jgi:CBS domain-containing membrane protein